MNPDQNRRGFLGALAGACVTAAAAGAPPAIDMSQGAHEGTAWDAANSRVMLNGGRSGSWTSPVFPKAASAVSLEWRETWTGPLRWEKYAGNPVLTAGEQDSGQLSTPCVLKDRGQITLFYGSRPHIRLAFGSMTAMGNWRRRSAPVLSAGPPGEFDAGGVNGPEIVRVSGKQWRCIMSATIPRRSRAGSPFISSVSPRVRTAD